MSTAINRKVDIAAWIVVVVAVILLVQAVADGIPRHGFDMSWPDHARFHLIWGVANQVGFSLAAVALALIPFRRAERWSWWVLCVWALLGFFSLFGAWHWQGSGPRPGFEIFLALVAIALLAALGLAFRVGFPVNGRK